ncbi:hypothetical protein ABH15_00845 [Methanoculleus taiwanensis]|uniref:Uncharacterized protein n=2 Tax=Methanoculleus taiwanensis TaxID=1550565 RepID=A0A498H3D1_9EURY|nr:hypothetical protein ABH15_00845 [Methanoculleus taiwanensis]
MERMRDVRVARFERAGVMHVEFRFKALDQLLDPADSSPLPERELTEFAEEYIFGYLRECRLQNLAGLNISLPQDQVSPEMQMLLPDTIRRQYLFRLSDLDHETRLSLREGRISLAIAVFNATIAVLFFSIFASYLESLVVILLGGLITILNWVTIWNTYEYFVYDYRHLMHRRRIYRKVPALEIKVLTWPLTGNPEETVHPADREIG